MTEALGDEPSSESAFHCEVQLAGARGLGRIVETLTLLGPLRTLGRTLARLALGYRRTAEVLAKPGQIEVREGLFVLGREVRSRVHWLDVNSLAEIALITPYRDLIWLARLAPITLGTSVGLWLVGRAALGWSYAAELIGLGALLVTLGLALDYLMVRGGPREMERAKLLLVPKHSPPLLLLGPRSVLRPWAEKWQIEASRG